MIGGVALGVLGVVTANPVLAGLGAAETAASAAAGTAAQLAGDKQDKAISAAEANAATNAANARQNAANAAANAAAKKREAEKLQKEAEAHHSMILRQMSQGALGDPAAQKAAYTFAKALAGGSTIGGAMRSAGMVPGFGSAQRKMMTNALDKHLTGGSGLQTAIAFGDATHRATALSRRGVHSAARGFLNQDKQVMVHQVYMAKTAGTSPGMPAQPTGRMAGDSAQMQQAGAGSTEGMLYSGRAQATQGGIVTSQYSG
jgi:hypothetical protein